MGGTQAVDIISQADALNDYQLMGVEENPKLGDVALYRHKRLGDITWVKDVPIEDRNIEAFMDEYIQNESWKQPCFITTNIKKIGKDTGSTLLCSASCSANLRYGVFMEYQEKDLETEIEQRANDLDGPDFFPEAELWYIVETIMSVESLILKHNRFHGDLRTSTIFIAEDGQMKFADPVLVDPNSNSYFKVLMKQAKCNLPPEYLQSLHANQREPKSNPELAEVFSFGIVLLAVSSLQIETAFYDWEAQEINWRAISAAINSVKAQYSELMVELLSQCLRERASDRLHLGEIIEYIERRKRALDDQPQN
jgi:Protein tyrosine and serine/threonine kinase